MKEHKMQKPVAPFVQDVWRGAEAGHTPCVPSTSNPLKQRLFAAGRGLVLFCIRAYQATAPMRPAVCRYQPTCSEYAAQCVVRHGVWKGVALGIRRILRCNPLSSGGYDPAP